MSEKLHAFRFALDLNRAQSAAAGIEPGTYPGRSVILSGDDRMRVIRMRRNELQTVISPEKLEAS